MVLTNDAAPKETFESQEDLPIALVLHDDELRQNLKAEGRVGLAIDAYVKASFAVDEANDPVRREFHQILGNERMDARRMASEDPGLSRFPAST